MGASDSDFTTGGQCPASGRIFWRWMRSNKFTQPVGFLGHETYYRPLRAVHVGEGDRVAGGAVLVELEE